MINERMVQNSKMFQARERKEWEDRDEKAHVAIDR